MFMEVGAPHPRPHSMHRIKTHLPRSLSIRLNASAVAFLERSNDSSRRGPRSTMWNCWGIGRSCNPAGLRSRSSRCIEGSNVMSHAIHRVEGFEIVGPYTLALRFADGSEQRIDFRPVLEGEVFGALQDLKMFNSVELDTRFGTVQWPNGADF